MDPAPKPTSPPVFILSQGTGALKQMLQPTRHLSLWTQPNLFLVGKTKRKKTHQAPGLKSSLRVFQQPEKRKPKGKKTTKPSEEICDMVQKRSRNGQRRPFQTAESAHMWLWVKIQIVHIPIQPLKSADPLPPVPASCRGDRRGMQLEVSGINDGPWGHKYKKSGPGTGPRTGPGTSPGTSPGTGPAGTGPGTASDYLQLSGTGPEPVPGPARSQPLVSDPTSNRCRNPVPPQAAPDTCFFSVAVSGLRLAPKSLRVGPGAVACPGWP